MFSEYASRFLAQSHSRLNNDNNDRNSRSSSRQRPHNPRTFVNAVSNMPSPYQTRFPFSQRPNNPAPLFHSINDGFGTENDIDDHQREVNDFYALQKSRKGFGPSHLAESSEGDEPDNDTEESQDQNDTSPFRRPIGRGIRSSWRGGTRSKAFESIQLNAEDDNISEHSSIDDLRSDDDLSEAPAIGAFSFNPPNQSINQSYQDSVTNSIMQKPKSLDNSVLPEITEEEEDQNYHQQQVQVTQKHDFVWAQLFIISNATLIASALLVWLHTDQPSNKTPLGDTIYTILRKSYFLLAVDTVIAIVVATVWLVLLRNALRPLTYLIVYSIPIILFAFTLWPFITSFQGSSIQYKWMRIFSAIPFAAAIVWTYLAIQSRYTIDRAISIIQLASNIISQSPSLFIAGFITLIATVLWFWIWLLMFTRVFLQGHWATSAKKLFIIDTTTWWLGIFFVLILLWTQMTISGLHRAVTAAAVSQWYFYRHTNQSANTSRDVLIASFQHASTTLLGTVTLSSLISLLVRIPILITPRKYSGYIAMCLYSIIPAPITSLTNPLTLTYAAVHSQSLALAARSFSRLPLSSDIPHSTQHRRNRKTDSLAAYRTTHMILHATRQIMALALGLGAWLSTLRLVKLSNVSYTGSIYAYIVGLAAALIGWGILGTIEGIIGGVVDSVLVCWASEVAAAQNGGNRGRIFCREAEDVFGDRYDERNIQV